MKTLTAFIFLQIPGNLETVFRARVLSPDEPDARGRVGSRGSPVFATVLRIQTEVHGST